MKKIFLIAGFGFIMSPSLFAQSPVMQGSILIDPYIGFPTSNSMWNNGGDGEDNYKVNGGQLSYGGRFEYMIADDFGIGIDANFVTCGYNFDQIDSISVYDPNTGTYSDSITSNNYDYTAKRTRIMVRINKHIVQTETVDAYIGVGAGYRLMSRVWQTNGVNDLEQEEALIPIACRLAIGARFYFTDNIGAHIELGALGGSVIQAGVAVKF